MDPTGNTLLGRFLDHIVGWIGFLLVALGVLALWQIGPDGRGALLSGLGRSAFWLAVVVALPWSAWWYIHRLLEVGSNWAGLALLVGLTSIDILLGVVLLTAWPASFWLWLVVLCLVGAAAAYNYLVAEYLAQRGGG